MGVPSEKLTWAVERIQEGIERVREITQHNPHDCYPDDLLALGRMALELHQLALEIQQRQATEPGAVEGGW